MEGDMPFQTDGTFERVHNWTEDKNNDINAQAERFDEDTNDIASGLTSLNLKNNDQDDRLDSIEAKNSDQDNRLDSIDEKNDEQDEAIEDLNEDLSGKLDFKIFPDDSNFNDLLNSDQNRPIEWKVRVTAGSQNGQPLGIPTDQQWYGYTASNHSFSYQIAYPQGASGSFYIRKKTSGVWSSDWRDISFKGAFPSSRIENNIFSSPVLDTQTFIAPANGQVIINNETNPNIFVSLTIDGVEVGRWTCGTSPGNDRYRTINVTAGSSIKLFSATSTTLAGSKFIYAQGEF